MKEEKKYLNLDSNYKSKYYINDLSDHQSIAINTSKKINFFQSEFLRNLPCSNENLKSSQLAYKNSKSSTLNTPCLSLYKSKYYINDLSDHQSDIFYKKYCINNQNDYIAKPSENSSNSSSIDTYKNLKSSQLVMNTSKKINFFQSEFLRNLPCLSLYKSKYYINDLSDHQNDIFYKKYYKYKKKYLEKKKLLGGKIPSLNGTILPILEKDGNYYTNRNLVLKSDTSDIKYNFPNVSFNYQQIESGFETDIEYKKLYLYADHDIVIDESNNIPFSLVLLEDNYKILTKFYKFCTEYVSENNNEFTFSTNQLKLLNDTFKKYYVFHRETKEYITLSVKPNILNNFLFIGKYRELLEIIFNDNTSDIFFQGKITEIFGNNQNFINFYDMIYAYKKITDSNKTINSSLLKMSDFSSVDKNTFNVYFKMFKKEVAELKEFNKILDTIDEKNMIEGTTPLNTKLSYLFYSIFVGLRLKKPRLTFKGNNNFYPINIKYTIQNLLNESYVEPEEISIETNNINLFKANNNFPNMESYSSSKYIHETGNYIFPDCVENTVYQLLKALTWNGIEYNTTYLPETTIPQIKDIFSRLRQDLNLKEEFIQVITNIPDLSEVYKKEDISSNVKYEIKSTIPNFKKVLSYIFNKDFKEDNYDILKINPSILNISFENETFKVDFGEKGKFLATIKPGHASHMISNDILNYFFNFEYINIIILFSQLYPLFSILRHNILLRFIQMNKNDPLLLKKINEIILLENDLCENQLILDRIDLDEDELNLKIKKNRKKRKKYTKGTDKYQKYDDKVQEYKAKLSEKITELETQNESIKANTDEKINKIIELFDSTNIIPFSKFLFLDYNLYYIDSPNNCFLLYDLDNSIYHNLNIYKEILVKFNEKDRENILVKLNFFTNYFERTRSEEYIHFLNLLDPSFPVKNAILIQENEEETITNLLKYILLKLDIYNENKSYSIIKNMVDKFSIELIEQFKFDNSKDILGKDLLISKISNIRNAELKSYLIDKFQLQ